MAVAQYIITARIVYRRFGMVYVTREMALEAIGNMQSFHNDLADIFEKNDIK